MTDYVKLSFSNPRNVKPLAGWSLDENLIKNSATGGIFAQIAKNMLEDGNTVVYGASLMEDSTVRHIEISRTEEIPLLQNSKYQQSQCHGIYKQVKKRLIHGSRVLFSGVPCQIAALRAFLNDNPSLTKQLYTIEVICHGVPCNDLHRTALQIEKAKRILSYRTKGEKGWIGNNNFLTYLLNNGAILTKESHKKDFLFRSYLTFSFSRPSCYSCKYAKINRISDLTIGDFWGWQLCDNREIYRNEQGISIILPNTEKGYFMASGNSLHTVNVRWRDILPLNQNLYMPTNSQIFVGSSNIHIIKRFFLPVKKIIYQGGFVNSRLDRIYYLFCRLMFGTSKKARTEKNKKLEETLDYVNHEW